MYISLTSPRVQICNDDANCLGYTAKRGGMRCNPRTMLPEP